LSALVVLEISFKFLHASNYSAHLTFIHCNYKFLNLSVGPIWSKMNDI
jgi:hypothetical protein